MADIFISTLAELQALALLSDWSGNNYFLTDGIDASPTANDNYGTGNEHDPISLNIGNTLGASNEGFLSIGNLTNAFNGTFTGNNKAISNMKINRTGETNGLFGFTGASVINDVYVTNVNISSSGRTGALAGALGAGSVTDGCYTSGTLTLIANKTTGTGGFAGNNRGNISKCYSQVNVIRNGIAGNIGGFCGSLSSGSSITDCYSTGNVTCTGTGDNIGGFVGINSSPCINCYSTGLVSTDLLATDTGGFCGARNSTITSCYYDVQTSGQTDINKGDPRDTQQMQTQSNYINWDFDTIWKMDGYPVLRAFLKDSKPSDIYSGDGKGVYGGKSIYGTNGIW